MDTAIEKEVLFNRISDDLSKNGFEILSTDKDRPWGGFLVIKEDQAQDFSNIYFDGIQIDQLKIAGKLSPKVLLVSPKARLSWQYHNRRAEIWQVISGIVGVITSPTNQEGEMKVLRAGERILLKQGERHRLIGLEDWGVVAEIWQHTDESNPSDESDIIRVQDDFGR